MFFRKLIVCLPACNFFFQKSMNMGIFRKLFYNTPYLENDCFHIINKILASFN